jgi:hypothetical protein
MNSKWTRRILAGILALAFAGAGADDYEAVALLAFK